MTSKLDKLIQFSRNTKHTSLYEWSLHEASPSSEKLSSDLIPFDWTIRFSASSLKLFSDLKIRRVYREGSSSSTELRTSTVLVADLAFDSAYSASSKWSGTRLSMFGTDRLVTTARLRIEEVADESTVEECTIWGCPSYQTEVDFHLRTIPDTLEVSLRVSGPRFQELCAVAASPVAQSLDVYLSRVDGLYSVWAPEIGTDSIKILADSEYHVVLGAEDAVQPPRLGVVGEFQLTLVRHAAIRSIISSPADEADDRDVPVPALAAFTEDARVIAAQSAQDSVARVHKAVASLAIPAWICVVLLGLLLVF
ncbi:MAG: hypothetical protein C0503_01935 [Gemmatimonas sp.]|nr:hypothetical protein [Gemmatimonas sp.]